MKITTNQRILSYLKYKNWVSSGQIQMMSLEWHTTGATIARRLRGLADDGLIERGIGYKHTAKYRLPVMSAEQANTFLESLKQETI